MELGAAGLNEQPFSTHGKPLANVSYASRLAAIEMLGDTCKHPTGAALLQGPGLSGKSTLIRTYIDSINADGFVAVVDGKGLNTTRLLISILRQFGYDLDLSSTSELLGLVRVLALQQATSHRAPLLIIENAHELNPSSVRTLSELAELRVRTGCALKFVLVGDRSLQSLVASPDMEPITRRLVHDFHLQPMNADECTNYLHRKLGAAGSQRPELVFPDDVCREICRASGGWPGIADRLALLALARTDSLPVLVKDVERPALPRGTWTGADPIEPSVADGVAIERPRLIVSNNGCVIDDMAMEKSRILVGRSEHNDISLDSRFVSRHHALFVRNGAATFLMDLNSTNGTLVNSRRVSNHVLIHDDVITLGHYRIKFHDPCATSRDASEEVADTAIMKTLQDMRSLLARGNTELMPAASEDMPTISTRPSDIR